MRMRKRFQFRLFLKETFSSAGIERNRESAFHEYKFKKIG